MGRRCSLCGGKLANNRCVECGLDNSKSDASYKLNVSECDKQPLTHVHNETQSTPIQQKEKNSTQKMKSNVQKKQKMVYQREIPHNKKVKKKSKLGGIVGKVIFVIVFLGIIGGVYDFIETFNYNSEKYDYDPYEYLENTLQENGDNFQNTYEGGEYVVGVHIPEGQYKVTLISGDGSIGVKDYTNHIFYSEYLSEDLDENEKGIEDFRLFSGAKVKVNAGMVVQLESENAQIDSISGSTNPLTEKVEITGEKIAGKDFVPGVYDISYRYSDEEKNAVGYMKYIVPGTLTEEDIEEYQSSTGSIFLTDPEEAYHNVVLPEGTIVTSEEGMILLTPSEVIASEDYVGYYEEEYITSE